MITTIADIVLILFVIASGLTAGLFWAYSYSVMRALAEVDDRTFVTVMNRINVAILNPWFGFCFGGGLFFGVAAVILVLIAGGPWLLTSAALVAYLIAVIITAAVNVPLNNALAGVDPAEGDAAAVADGRGSFENRWRQGNNARAVVHTVAFAVACVALLVS